MDENDTPSNEGEHTETSTPTITKGVIDSPANTSKANANPTNSEAKPMSSFERSLVVLTIAGIVIALLTGVIFYGQFKEMIGQTDVADIAARQARKDSADSAKTVEKQLAIAQQQATAASDNVKENKRALSATLRQAQKALDASINAAQSEQRAYVTIGKPDGTVADILWPKDDKGTVGLLVYFQNNGRLPAKFNWGASSPTLEILPADPAITRYEDWKDGKFFDLPTNHQLHPMYRMKSKDGKGVQWSGTIDIAGGSSYQGVLWEIPKERMLQLMRFENKPFMPSGKFEYCDGFGNRVCKNFTLSYAKEPYSRFFLIFESECSDWEMQINQPLPGYDYLPVCEVSRPEFHLAIPGLPKPQ